MNHAGRGGLSWYQHCRTHFKAPLSPSAKPCRTQIKLSMSRNLSYEMVRMMITWSTTNLLCHPTNERVRTHLWIQNWTLQCGIMIQWSHLISSLDDSQLALVRVHIRKECSTVDRHSIILLLQSYCKFLRALDKEVHIPTVWKPVTCHQRYSVASAGKYGKYVWQGPNGRCVWCLYSSSKHLHS